ncbi:ABC-2 transporter permease [Staphylococcus hominis]|uniref:ABC-2 transporter permease n=1 Tax=Staphylococcus hominis TaxID=1290 RepID=UPI0011A1A6C5
MRGLIFKDIILFLKYFKNLYLITIIIIALSLSFTIFSDEFVMIGILMLFLFINFNSNLFIEDDHSRWLKFIKTNSHIKNSSLVLSRYISTISTTILGNFIFLTLSLLHNQIYHTQTLKNSLIITGVTFFISLIYIILVIPFIYMFLQNGIIVLMIFVAALVLIFKNFLDINIINRIFQFDTSLLLLLCTLIILLLFIIFYLLSLTIIKYKFKE